MSQNLRWTPQQYATHLAKRKLTQIDNRPSQGAKPEPIVRHEPLAEAKRKAGYSDRIHVCIVSYRKRLIDPDNLCPKFFVDCLRYSGIIPDDRAKDITLEVRQEKSDDERTEITLSSP